jgi:hypothetical protein
LNREDLREGKNWFLARQAEPCLQSPPEPATAPASFPTEQAFHDRTTHDKTVSIVIDIFDLRPFGLAPAIDS